MVPEILVLGPVRAVVTDGRQTDGREIVPASRLQLLLVAVLTAHRGRVVSVDQLVDALWGEQLPAHPAAALQSQVFRLRRLLGGSSSIATDGAGYRLRPERALVDADQFEDLVQRARDPEGDGGRALRLYDDALACWRGRAYAEVADHDLVRPEATRVEELRVEAAEERAELLLQADRPAEAAAAMEALMAEEPYREAPVSIRMRGLAAAGRHAEAVLGFATFRRVLDELGLEPSPQLAALEADILRHEYHRWPPVRPGQTFTRRG